MKKRRGLGSLGDGATSRARTAAKRARLSPEEREAADRETARAETRSLFYHSARRLILGRDLDRISSFEARCGCAQPEGEELDQAGEPADEPTKPGRRKPPSA